MESTDGVDIHAVRYSMSESLDRSSTSKHTLYYSFTRRRLSVGLRNIGHVKPARAKHTHARARTAFYDSPMRLPVATAGDD